MLEIGRRAITVLVFNTTLQLLEIISITPFQAPGSKSLEIRWRLGLRLRLKLGWGQVIEPVHKNLQEAASILIWL